MKRKNRMALICLTAICFIYVPPAASTTIVVYWRPDEIFIGVDSLRLNTVAGGATPDRVCKISKFKGFYFAVSGATRETSTGYDARQVARAVESDGRSPTKAAQLFVQRVRGPFKTAMEWARENVPQHYQTMYEGKEPLTALFFGIENGKAVLVTISFRVDSVGAKKVSVTLTTNETCPGPTCQTERWVVLGEREAIVPLFGEGLSGARPTLASTIRRLIEIETAAAPDRVGPPINVFRLGADGSQWLYRGPGSTCTDN